MIGRLREIIGALVPAEEESVSDQELDLAAAVLLVEMARTDHELDDIEEREIRRQLETGFGLRATEVDSLLERAHATVEESVSLHEFTRALHTGMDYDEKLRVVEMLWRVALADNELDKYEDYLVGKVADLLYVSRGDVIRLRQRVVEANARN
ncbi:MAG: TerB family tellurite resistance protein [Gammaproteobacteria bacterium]|nr:TerB family tellurite resistance protein [Gammaproteobacteria bacterium]